jgi:hypothetical protein
MKDMIVLVPDRNMRFGIDSLLYRHDSLNIRQISYDILIHPRHDPGIYCEGVELLRDFTNQYRYALVFIDHEGSGQENASVDEIANHIKYGLENNGWQDRAEVIVFEPELEIWLWAESTHTANVLGWDDYNTLKNWLVSKGLWEEDAPKPMKPKKALEMSLAVKRISRTSSIYEEIASKVSLHRCRVPSFLKFREILQKWFPKNEGGINVQ